MNINGNVVIKITEIQEKRSRGSDYFKNNNLLAFALALSSKKTTVISTTISSLNMTEIEVEEYIEILEKERLISVQDRKNLKKVKNTYISKNYDQEIEAVVDHFNRVSGKNKKPTKTVKSFLTGLMASGDYELSDFKTVSLYYVKQWENNPDMSKYISLDTFFRPTKFEDKLDKAKEYFEKINAYKLETSKFCRKFKGRVIQEYFPKNRLMSSGNCSMDKFSCSDDVPLKLQESLIFWLEKNYDIDEIIDVVQLTIDNWKKNPKYINHISFNRILDERFNERYDVAKRIQEKKEHKSSVSNLNDWANNDPERKTGSVNNLDAFLESKPIEVKVIEGKKS